VRRPLEPDVWHRVGVVLEEAGGARLFVDGEEADEAGEFLDEPFRFECGTGEAASIRGNDLPWTFGASTSTTADPRFPMDFAVGTRLDHLRLSRVRRAY